MTTYYVSNEATNGYMVGDNANDGLTKAKAFETLTYAETQLSAGDTVILNDGTYPEAAFVTFNLDNITLQGESRHGAIVQCAAAGQNRILHITGDGMTIGNIVLDANNDDNGCLTASNATGSITISGTKFLNPVQQFVLWDGIKTITMKDNWVAEGGTMSSDGFRFTANIADSSWTVQDGTMTITDLVSTGAGMCFDPAAAGQTAVMHDVVMNIAGSEATDFIRGIWTSGPESLLCYNNTINITGVDNPVGIDVRNDAVDIMDSCHVYDNTITADSKAGGLGISVGKDADTDVNENRVTKARIYRNTLTGFNHGLLAGNVTDTHFYGNKASGNVLGILYKNATDCRSYGNVIINCSGQGALRFKGAVNGIHANNLVIIETGQVFATANILFADEAGAQISTGCAWYNNSIYCDGQIGDWVTVEAGHDASFDGNNYYLDSSGTVSADPFNYQGTPYASVTAFNAAATVGTETETDPEIDTDTYLSAGLTGTGVNWNSGQNGTGYGGEPFPTFDIDVGAVQSTTGAFHPVNL